LFVKHNLDLGGNPQRQLFSFTQQQIESLKNVVLKTVIKLRLAWLV
jgi:hypothetical protein